MEFPDYDLNSPTFDRPAAPPAPASTAAPAPAAAPEPTVDVAPVHDPLWAPLSAEQQPEPTAPAAAPAAAAPPAPQFTPEQQHLAQQTQLLSQLVDRLNTPTQPQTQTPAEPAAPRDPKSVAVEQALLKHVPELGPILEAFRDPAKAEALRMILDAAPQHQADLQRFHQEFADQTADTLAQTYASAYGVDLGTMTPEQKFELESDMSAQFLQWLQRPANARMAAAYERGDARVVGEFGKYFTQRFVAPAKREGQVAVTKRAATVAALPRGGGSQIPTPAQSAPVRTPTGERDVFSEAWQELSGARAAG